MLQDLGEDKAAPLLRYVAAIQSQRGDYNGRVLSIRQDDLRTLSVIFDLQPSVLVDLLIEWGVLDPDARRAVDFDGDFSDEDDIDEDEVDRTRTKQWLRRSSPRPSRLDLRSDAQLLLKRRRVGFASTGSLAPAERRVGRLLTCVRRRRKHTKRCHAARLRDMAEGIPLTSAGAPRRSSVSHRGCAAVSYSPTRSPLQYHRRWRA